MNFYPILTRELRCFDWQRSFYRQRLGFGLTGSALLLALAVVEHFNGTVKAVSPPVAGVLAGTIPFMLFIVGLHGAGPLLGTERREGTLPVLLITRLSGCEIIFGKLIQSVMTQGVILLAAVPGTLLPLMVLGFETRELCFLVLAYENVLFFSLALGLLGAVFADTRSAPSWCLLFYAPILIYSSPFTVFLPGGGLMESLALLQWLNPCAAVARAQGAAAGWRPDLFWSSLLTTQTLGWVFAVTAGFLLPRAVRRDAARQPRRPSKRSSQTSFEARRRSLDRNPFFWLNSRERCTTLAIWLWIIIPALAWGFFIGLIWYWRTLNVAFVFVIAMGVSWALGLVFTIPAQATRQLVADRLNGLFEVLFCTPITPKLIAHGIWLSLRRYYLVPTATVLILSTVLMGAGYLTSGFGGMLDAQDRSRWLWAWLTGMVFIPLTLWALCWVALHRALFVRNAGEAAAVACLEVFGAIAFILWMGSIATGLSYLDSPIFSSSMAGVVALTLVAFALRARRGFLGPDTRSAPAGLPRLRKLSAAVPKWAGIVQPSIARK